ncbi:Keratin-associated protein [Trichinella spiralis]|uniref:Keratin-associated protein n=1 Tax=Trichinella spiralis TaxID=6334 RepID=A0ABR3K8J8_TRISP
MYDRRDACKRTNRRQACLSSFCSRVLARHFSLVAFGCHPKYIVTLVVKHSGRGQSRKQDIAVCRRPWITFIICRMRKGEGEEGSSVKPYNIRCLVERRTFVDCLFICLVGQSDVVVVDDRCCFSRAQLLCSPARVNVLGGFSLLLFVVLVVVDWLA